MSRRREAVGFFEGVEHLAEGSGLWRAKVDGGGQQCLRVGRRAASVAGAKCQVLLRREACAGASSLVGEAVAAAGIVYHGDRRLHIATGDYPLHRTIWSSPRSPRPAGRDRRLTGMIEAASTFERRARGTEDTLPHGLIMHRR